MGYGPGIADNDRGTDGDDAIRRTEAAEGAGLTPTLRHLWRRHPVTLLAFVLAVVLALFLGFRFTVHAVYWSRHRDDALAGWMTIGYVAQSYRVDRDDLSLALGVEPGSGRRLTLDDLARQSGRPVSELEESLRAAIAEARAAEEARR
jgi:hypothetical protein